MVLPWTSTTVYKYIYHTTSRQTNLHLLLCFPVVFFIVRCSLIYNMACNLSEVLNQLQTTRDGKVAVLKAIVGEVSTIIECKNGGKLLMVALFDEGSVSRLMCYQEKLFIFFAVGHMVRVSNCCYKSGEFVISSGFKNSNTSTTAAKLMKVLIPKAKADQCHNMLFPSQQVVPIKDLKRGQYVTTIGVVQKVCNIQL